MINEILVIVELKEGHLKGVSQEILGLCSLQAKKNGAKVKALVVNDTVSDDTYKEIQSWGITEIILIQSPGLEVYNPELVLPSITETIKELQSQVIFMGNTAAGKDLLPRLAQAIPGFMASDVTEFNITAEGVHLTRPIYGGRLLEDIKATSFPLYITVRPNVLGKHPGSAKNYHVTTKPVSDINKLSYVVQDIIKSGKKEKLLNEAEIVIAGGWGAHKEDGFKLLEELADTMGAAIAASRKIVDEGLKPFSCQIGQTGKTVSPRLYIACGISGANQHVAGMSGSQVVVAINKDPDAPIFKAADYCIVGDLYQILPVLTRELKKIL